MATRTTPCAALALAAALFCWTATAAEPVRIGFSMALTGGTAAIGKQILLTFELWRDQVNAKGGLLGRPVELVYYDDQTNPSVVPGIYAKLINVDKVDLLIGPYATNMVAAALPIIMQYGKTTIGLLANAANSNFHYANYFSMIPSGPNPKASFSEGYFTLAAAQTPKPRTVAIVGADAEYARNATDGARELAAKFGFEIVYDKSYPPSNTDYTPILRAIQAVHPDIVYVASYPPDSVGIIRAANEIGLDTKMFGGAMVGPQITATAMQLGPLLNGIVNNAAFVVDDIMANPETAAVLRAYQEKAPAQGIDPLGYTFPPYAFAAMQILAEAVTATKGFDQDKIAAYVRTHRFHTPVGDIAFGKDGEWDETRALFGQFQHITGNGIDQFRGWPHQPVLWPAKFKTGNLIYPYTAARN
ncbi:MAG TPA: amino acid ABC transporter substrate-binding protein [Stellaceae bacterium]|nr:amino acid ABC transporter substrate-binding protein [Stellaceae bacterium]